jgi:hypothetical protein
MAQGGAPHGGDLLRTMVAARAAQVATTTVATSVGRVEDLKM